MQDNHTSDISRDSVLQPNSDKSVRANPNFTVFELARISPVCAITLFDVRQVSSSTMIFGGEKPKAHRPTQP